MLRFVTQKLKSQSLNEVNQPFEYKSDDDDRDSGTESDDENTEYEDSKEATRNDEVGLGGERRSFGGMIHPSRPPNFDEETSTGSPDDLQYSSSHHHYVSGGTFRDLPSSMQLETTDESVNQPRTTRGSRRITGRSERRSAITTVVDQTSAGEHFSDSVNTSSSHIPSPVSSSMLDVDSALPSDSDHFEHQSSEEELDGFNFKANLTTPTTVKSFRAKSKELTAVSLCLTSDDDDDYEEDEKASRQRSPPHGRRSSRRIVVNQSLKSKPNNFLDNKSTTTTAKTANKKRNGGFSNGSTSGGYHPEKRKWSQANRRSCGDSSADSSDEEVRDLMYVCSPSTPPVEFCTSPPAELIRPTRSSLISKFNTSANLTPAPSLTSATSANSNNNNNNLISTTTTNFSAFSYISVSLPCSPSSFLSNDAGNSNVTRSPPAKLFQFSSSNFIPFEVCAVSPRKRHRQNVSSCHYQHYPHLLQQQNQFQPVNGGTTEQNGRRYQSTTNLSNISNDSISSAILINQFDHTLTTTNGFSNSNNATGQSRNNGQSGVSGQQRIQPLRQRPCLDFEKMQQVRSRQMSHIRRRCRN
ncbi:hypothetical protein CHUAL_009679 [Chamberlinius hualienensis]